MNVTGRGYLTPNVAFRGGYLYMREAEQNIAWRVRTNIPGGKLYCDR